ncbi:putative transporter [compost metagenome]
MILTSIPFLFLLVAMAYGLVKWLHSDYRHRSAADIEAESRSLGAMKDEPVSREVQASVPVSA